MSCPERTRRIPDVIAKQRGLPRGSRETVSPQRYVVGTDDPAIPCVRGEGRGTRCYAEHSPRRKHCRLLAPSAFASRFRPGLHVRGLPPFDAEEVVCNIGSLDDDDAPFATLILGPYPSPLARDPLRLVVKCLDFALLFDDFHHPENVALRFRVGNDKHIPSIDMMQGARQRLQEASVPRDYRGAVQNFVRCTDTLLERRRVLQSIRRRCAQSPPFERAARILVRNTFHFAMYARRWAGPGTPYPISKHETNRLVGRHKKISAALIDQAVHVTAGGEVVVRGRKGEDEPRADAVSDGKATEMMYAHLRAIHRVVEAADANVRNALVTNLLMSVDALPTVDGSHWPAEETLWECLFDSERSVAAATSCIRQQSNVLLCTCRLLIPYVYKAVPTWSRYEGVLDEVQ